LEIFIDLLLGLFTFDIDLFLRGIFYLIGLSIGVLLILYLGVVYPNGNSLIKKQLLSSYGFLKVNPGLF